ncbi:uncharacterized protein LOC126235110 [Schistocerca nitens]|uniref:uncharacterized protein LOC126235110 n=1 Tax=Schistocerca nitens TaxID=7011 RepID=UPI002117CAE1|nr:uncharacterized protein LOC126235110 [Schistocerca nitens]
MPGCAVTGCFSYNRDTKGTDVMYHSFPHNETLQKLWLSKCCRKDSVNVAHARICSRHFAETDYLRDLQSELLNLPRKRILKPDAVPSCNLPRSSATVNVSPATEDRTKRYKKRELPKRSLETLEKLSPNKKLHNKSTCTDDRTQIKLL